MGEGNGVGIERAKMLGWKPQIEIKNGLLDMINYIKSINFDE